MFRSRRSLRWALLAALLPTTGCVLLFQDGVFQSIAFHFTATQEIAADQPFDVEMLVHPIAIDLKKHYAQLSGRLVPPDGEELPAVVEVRVLTEDAGGKRVDQIRKSVRIREDGGFLESQKLRKNLPAGAVQLITLQPEGVPIPQGTQVHLCLDIVDTRADLDAANDCSDDDGGQPGPGDETVVVQIVDTAFNPQRVTIDPGQTVRWVFQGTLTTHSVSAEDATVFDSGFIFRTPGDFFEVTFGQEHDDQTFRYYCRTHHSCCEMQGSVLVGSNAPDPGDRY
jgi:plastocyanin